ncbi:universal stress protein [Piscinibacter sakaiensis]|uniref:universal stress protein n=1 Tax=Piscinibacter sakaiensis TaxID=1547922 RepID=UPI003AAEB158
MTYRSLIVLLGSDERNAVRTATAIELARRFEAHLVGLAPTGIVDLPVVTDPSGSMGNLVELAWGSLRDEAAKNAAAFQQACSEAGLPSFEAVVDEADRIGSLVHHAHCSDLCIVSQAGLDAPDRRKQQRALEQMVLDCARPTLILPDAGVFRSVGSQVMIAWDDSREAARAVSDALPLLRIADGVEVINWIESKADDELAQSTRLQALQRWLMWQGVSAEIKTEVSEIPIAEAMLSRAADGQADLIVMGAYGHSRWTERLLGGATRGILGSMTVPIVMSH